MREGTLSIGSSGKPNSIADGAEFYFDGTAEKGILAFINCDRNLKDAWLHSSTNELPVSNHGVTDSSQGRTLTIFGNSPVDEQYYEGGFMGKLSFVWNPSNAARFTIARSTSPTTGSIVISNGTFCVTNGASFTALDTIRVCGNGVLEPAPDAGAITMGTLHMTENGRVKVAAGQTWTTCSVTTNGASVPFGDYTAANAAWVAGEGTVHIDAYPGAVEPIMLAVGEGLTKTIAETLAAYNAEHAGEEGFADVTLETLNGGADKLRSLVKKGKGRLNMDTAISSFEGSVFVDEGVLYTGCRYSIGKENNDNAPVYVRKGATFLTATTETVVNANRTFHIAGSGASGYLGALSCGWNGVSGNYGNDKCFGKKIVLEDDAAAQVGGWMYCGNAEGVLKLNGHTFTIRGQAGNAADCPFFLPKTIQDDGHIVVLDGQWSKSPKTTFTGTSPDNSVVFGYRGGFRFANKGEAFADGAGAKSWKWIFNGPESNFYTDYNLNPRDTHNNFLDVPLELNTMIRFWYQSDRRRGYMLVEAPVSGTGGFTTTGDRTIFLHMITPGNMFTGGLDFTRGTIWTYANGAIPNGTDAGKVVLHPSSAPYNVISDNSSQHFQNTFDGIAFMTPETYVLPELEASGSIASRVQGGQGAWTKVTQNGAGLDYYSAVGAPLLDVQKGTFRLPRGGNPGLWEGTNVCVDAAAATAAYGSTVTYTNLALRGPTAIIPRIAYNYTSWMANEVITYTGYVWNRTGADATWTFALAPKAGSAKLLVNGAVVVEGSGSAVTKGNVTLAPGANAIECRLLNAGGARAASADWPALFGCVYDPEGRDSLSNTNNFLGCVDTGDGALFTRTVEGGLPAFDVMQFATNTVLNVNGNAYTAAVVKGFPSVVSTATDASAAPAFTIADRFEIDGAKTVGTLSSAVPLTFGPDCVFSATNLASLAHGKYTIAKTTGDAMLTVQGNLARSRFTTDVKKWSVQVAPDGKSIQLAYSPGFMVIVK